MDEFMGGFDEPIELPPGFRFHPTDEELITHYLCPKVADGGFTSAAIGEVDLNRIEPWDLPWKAKIGEKEWYFFCIRDRKYPTGSRTNRATVAGYWKATGKDKEIFQGKALEGMKKTLVFYRGRAPTGKKTNWVMHEYRLEGKQLGNKSLPESAKKEWVICRVFNKDSGGKKVHISGLVRSADSECSNLPTLMELSPDENRVRIRGDGADGCLSRALEDPGEKPCDKFTAFPLMLPKLCGQDSNLMADQSVLQRLMGSSVPDTKKAEFLQEMMTYPPPMSSCNEVGFRHYEDLEFPAVSTVPVDLDCLWNY